LNIFLILVSIKEKIATFTTNHKMCAIFSKKYNLEPLVTRASVLQREVLVLELVSIDGLSASAIVVGEVTTLAHEVGNDTVEGGGLEAVALLAGAQGAEVFSGPGYDVRAQLKMST
jgi:hypothetical protein